MSDRDSFGERPLKKITLQHIEAAIAEALSELAGTRYTASVVRFDFEPSSSAALLDTYELTIRVSPSIPSSRASGEEEDNERAVEAQDLNDGKLPALEQPTRSTLDRMLTGLTGRQLNQEWEVGARHALYHHEGRWYHQLQRFPGALFDYNGYVLFNTQEAFANCPLLSITQDVYVPKGIAAIPGYVRRR